jgi:hypothetical protein
LIGNLYRTRRATLVFGWFATSNSPVTLLDPQRGHRMRQPSPSEFVVLERICEMSFPTLVQNCFAT